MKNVFTSIFTDWKLFNQTCEVLQTSIPILICLFNFLFTEDTILIDSYGVQWVFCLNAQIFLYSSPYRCTNCGSLLLRLHLCRSRLNPSVSAAGDGDKQSQSVMSSEESSPADKADNEILRWLSQYSIVPLQVEIPFWNRSFSSCLGKNF